jgi:hypothetical protein
MNRPAGEEGTRAVADMTTDLAQHSHKYTCPMHPDVILEKPGNCLKCGMKLIERG